MIPKKEGWHYIAVTRWFALSRGITSKNNGNFYCLSCPRFFRMKHKLDSHKKICEDFGNIMMSLLKTLKY